MKIRLILSFSVFVMWISTPIKAKCFNDVNSIHVNGVTITGSNTPNAGSPLTVSVSNNVSLCSGVATTLCAYPAGGTGGVVFSWEPGNFSTPCITVAPTSTTIYTLTVTDNSNEKATAMVTVQVNPLPNVNFSGELYQGCIPLCIGFHNLSTISGGRIESNIWSFGNGDTLIDNSPAFCYLNSGVYSVSLTVTTDSGCSSTLNKPNLVKAFSLPNASFTYSPQPINILDPTVQFSDNSNGTSPIIYWGWTFGDATDSIAEGANASHTYQDTGEYCATLVVTDMHGCSDTVTNCLKIEPYFALYIPSAFTPNGNSLNGIFKPEGQYVKNFEMYIFSRSGEQVYHTTNIDAGWNGTLNNSSTVSEQGTYEYKILATDLGNTQHSYVGNVTLIR